MGKYYKHILFFTFILAVLLVALIQFNSNRSIDELISSNENVLEELTTKNDIQQFQNALLIYETKTRGAILKNNNGDSAIMQNDVQQIQKQLKKLDSLKDNQTLIPVITELSTLINQKITFNTGILKKLKTNGRDSAEALLNSSYNKQLNLRLKDLTNSIDSIHSYTISSAVRAADRKGSDAKSFGLTLALLATAISIFAFGYVIYKIKEQQLLIKKLNHAEQEALEAARIKESFLTNMSHEIRTPLNAIIGFTNLLLKKPLGADAHEQLTAISTANENLSGIINNILDLSRLEAGMMPMELISFDAPRLFRNIEQLFKPRIAAKGLDLSMHISPNVPQHITSDPLKLTQIVSNLLSNAVKFTETGVITVDANCIMLDGALWLLIDVTDTGIGIAPEHQSKIFNRFQQAEDATSRKYGGSGLGLPIVKELLTILNGSLSLNSDASGTKISLRIPVKAAETAETDLAGMHLDTVTFDGNILIVEDQPLNQKLLQHLLKRWNLAYKTASSGPEAIALLKEYSFDVILMDIQIPGMDGYQTTAAIRQTLQLDTPVIAVTAHALPAEKSKCIAAGMNDYLAKPIAEGQLQNLLRRYLNKTKTPGTYHTINLSYLQNLSMGNTEYEQSMTGDFISQSLDELTALSAAISEKQYAEIARYAHQLRSTAGIMGLTEKTAPLLDQLEYHNEDIVMAAENYYKLEAILQAARTEAAVYLLSLNNT